MSIYSKNYKKMTDGYNKIMSSIKSLETINQAPCVGRMIDSWLGLVEGYCVDVDKEWKNLRHRKEANHLASVCKQMMDDITDDYQGAINELAPREYEGVFAPTRIKSIVEMVHEQNMMVESDDEK